MGILMEKFNAIEIDLNKMRKLVFDGNFSDDILDVVNEIRNEVKTLQEYKDETVYRLTHEDVHYSIDWCLESQGKKHGDLTDSQRDACYYAVEGMDSSIIFEDMKLIIEMVLDKEKEKEDGKR